MDLYNLAEIKNNHIILDGQQYRLVKGKHEMWVPDKEMKIVWSFNGKIESYVDWDKGRNRKAIEAQTFNELEGWDRGTLKSILDEYYIFSELNRWNMSPGIKGLFYIKNVISDYPLGLENCDSMGMYGFYIQDAKKLEKGEFTLERFKGQMIDTGLVTASKTAMGDLEKDNPSAYTNINLINGYLIDVRRTRWDMMKWNGGYAHIQLEDLIWEEDQEELKRDILNLSQFPYKKRKSNYQSYFLVNHYEKGSRDTIYRLNKMGIPESLEGKNVVDLGSQLGSVALECYRRGARKVTGLEHEKDYVDCARRLARINKFQINFLQWDLKKVEETWGYLNKYYPKGIDVLFMLSMYKHILPEEFSRLLHGINWKTCYVESNNAPNGLETGHVADMIKIFNSLNNCKVDFLGWTSDRSPRAIWKLER